MSSHMLDLMHSSGLQDNTFWGIYADAFGAAYPNEIEPFGQCSWWMLAQMVEGLMLEPDQQLVDLGCGSGGPGLWLARAFAANLTGMDFSPVAIANASQRAKKLHFTTKSDFRIGLIEDTRLPSASADGVICIDAISNTSSCLVALREIFRILRPGGRAMVTVGETSCASPTHPRAVSNWHSLVTSAGLTLTERTLIPYANGAWQRFYAIWCSREQVLREHLGNRLVHHFLREADKVLPLLEENHHSELVLSLTRPN